MESNNKKETEGKKKRIVIGWFLGLLFLPFVLWYISGVDSTPTGAMYFWIVNVGLPIILAAIIYPITSIIKKRRPIISINQQFLILATVLVLIMTLISFAGLQTL